MNTAIYLIRCYDKTLNIINYLVTSDLGILESIIGRGT